MSALQSVSICTYMCAAAYYHQTKGQVCVGVGGGTHYIGVGRDNQMSLCFQSLSGTGVCFITKIYGKWFHSVAVMLIFSSLPIARPALPIIFMIVVVCRVFFFKISFFRQNLSTSVKQFASRSGLHFVRPDLGPNCLQKLSLSTQRLRENTLHTTHYQRESARRIFFETGSFAIYQIFLV